METSLKSIPSIDHAHEPLVVLPVRRVVVNGDAKLGRKTEIGTVGTGLVPALHGGSQRAQYDRQVKIARLVPFV